jgi:hypothetical protein
MSFLKVEMRGLEQTQKSIQESYSQFLERVATTTEDALKDFTPVRTGRLQNGWNKQVKKDGFEVNNRVPYGVYLEQGTSRMRAANKGRGIVGPALNSIKGKTI